MKNFISKGCLSTLVVLGILMLDQIIKIAVKTTMYYGQEIRITDWFRIHFLENPGMAFGMQLIPKALQTVSRVVLAGVIIWYVALLVKANFKRSYLVCVSLILAGAIGNIIDSIFYGVIFSQSTSTELATFVPVGHGYVDWLYGRVVDMFYFPLFNFDWPSWIPYVGGTNFEFFAPVFNLADASISCGMFILILFCRKDFERSITLVKNDFNRLYKRYHF